MNEGKLPTETTCGAKLKRGKGTCKKPLGWGTEHVGYGRCKLHGGNTPNQMKNAARVQGVELAQRYGNPREVEPEAALLEELARTAGHVDWLGEVVGDLDQQAMVGPVGGGSESFPRWEPSVWIRMYQAERDHLAQVAAACIKAGIEERRVRLAEQQGQLLAQVIRGVLTELGVPLEAEKTKKAVRRHLTLVEGTGTEQAA